MKRVTDETVAKMAALACNASSVRGMGLGFLQSRPGDTFGPADFKDEVDSGELRLDYVQGRMVKLRMSRDKADGLWPVPEYEPRADYQSWCRTYPTYDALAETAESWSTPETRKADHWAR